MRRGSIPVTLTNQQSSDEKPALGDHVAFFDSLRAAAGAYAAAILSASDGLLSARDMALVNLTSDFKGELFVGEAIFDVVLQRIGATSLTFAMELSQSGKVAATISVVLVHVGDGRESSVPFTAAQRSALERLLA
jgi:acyl-CoA thioesterase FadM